MQRGSLLEPQRPGVTLRPAGGLRRCACGGLSGPGGECAACRQRREARESRPVGTPATPAAAPLETGPDAQAAEDAAARTAARVSAGLPVKVSAQPVTGLQRQGLGLSNAAVPKFQIGWPSPGVQLDPGTRQTMESRFGHDFSHVRLHTGREATQRAQQVEARAYTLGHDIAFAAGEYAPATRAGQRLLAHELTHVIQQEGAAPLVQRAPADISPQDVAAARRRASRLAQRIRVHTRLSKEVKSNINRDLAFFGGAAKDAYIQVIRPALLAVTEIQMPQEDMTRPLPPVRPVTSLWMSTNELSGGRRVSDDEIYAPLRELEQREQEAQGQRRQAQVDRLQAMMTEDNWSAEYQTLALDLLGQALRGSLHPDPRGVSDYTRPILLARYGVILRNMDAQRMAACAQGGPGLLATIRGRARGDDPCKSWFKDDHSHGPSELHGLESSLRIFRNTHLPAAEKVYYDVFEYRKRVDPVLLEQAQLASAMVNLFTGVAGGVNARVNRPPAGSTVAPPKPPSTAPDLRVVQGGGQTTPPIQGHLTDIDKPPTRPTFQPGTTPAANDNAVTPPLRATGTDPMRPPAPPPRDNRPQATRRVVTPDVTKVAPPGQGTRTPAKLPDQEPEPDTGGVTSDRPYRGQGRRQMSKTYAHDVGVSEGTKAATRDGLEHVYDNPFGISPTTPGQDSVFRNRANQRPVVVEFKGGDARLAPGQMGNAEINRQIRDLERRLPNHPVTRMLSEALDNGTLTGRTYSTRIDATGTPLDTTVQSHGPYQRTP